MIKSGKLPCCKYRRLVRTAEGKATKKTKVALLKARILDLLYPQGLKCALCGKEALTREGVCESCRHEIQVCSRKELPEEFDGFAASLLYNEALRKTIHRFKYNGETHLAGFLARSIIIPEQWNIDLIIPVPLYPKRLRKRGYNQSELLAHEISRRIGTAVDASMLRRIRDTETQTELSEKERRENVKGAFAVKVKCVGKRILLIDDVCTTGSTMSECAAMLRKAGAAAVYGASAAIVTVSE